MMQAPVGSAINSTGGEIHVEVPIRFLRFAASDAQRVIAIFTLSSPERFTDVRGHGLRRFPKLMYVQDSSRSRGVNHLIDFDGDLNGRVQHREPAIESHRLMMQPAQ